MYGFCTYFFSFVFSHLQQREGSAILSSGDWVLSADELASKITPRTKALVINTPNNPLGKVRLIMPSRGRYRAHKSDLGCGIFN